MCRSSEVNGSTSARRWLLGFIALTFIAIGGYFVYFQAFGNFHVVTPGELYRSAQLSETQFEYYIKKYHIRSVLNLRGAHPHSVWYKEEIDVCRELHVRHYDFGISAIHRVSIGQMQEIIDLLRKAPKPILIHCRGGSDRSGLVAALWEFAVMHKPPSVAVKQLSIWYGHFPYFGNETVAMDQSFWNYVHYVESDTFSRRVVLVLSLVLLESFKIVTPFKFD